MLIHQKWGNNLKAYNHNKKIKSFFRLPMFLELHQAEVSKIKT